MFVYESILERVAEWLKAADCKSVDVFYAGSNPASLKKGRYISWMKHFIYTNLKIGKWFKNNGIIGDTS